MIRFSVSAHVVNTGGVIISPAETHVATPPPPSAAVVDTFEDICPNSEWREYENNCYYMPSTREMKSYDEAQEHCRNLAGDGYAAQLASISSDGESYFIRENSIYRQHNHWIGLRKEKTGMDSYSCYRHDAL